MEEKLRTLKLKKATLYANIEMLATVNDSAYLQFGKLEADIMRLEKEIVRQSQNPIA